MEVVLVGGGGGQCTSSYYWAESGEDINHTRTDTRTCTSHAASWGDGVQYLGQGPRSLPEMLERGGKQKKGRRRRRRGNGEKSKTSCHLLSAVTGCCGFQDWVTVFPVCIITRIRWLLCLCIYLNHAETGVYFGRSFSSSSVLLKLNFNLVFSWLLYS